MPVGLVAFEILSSVRLQSKNSGYLLRKHLKILSRIRPKLGTVLLTVVTVYLVCSRLGPVITRVGESAYETLEVENTLRHGLELEKEGLQIFREACRRFRDAIRVPGPLARRYIYKKLFESERERERVKEGYLAILNCQGQSSCFFPVNVCMTLGYPQLSFVRLCYISYSSTNAIIPWPVFQ